MCLSGGLAWADDPEMESLRQRLDSLERRNEQLESLVTRRLPALDVSHDLPRNVEAQTINSEMTSADAAVDENGELRPISGSLEKALEAWEKIDFYGQIRFRQENDFERINAPVRSRQRLRVRLGGTYQFDPEVLLGLRMTTGDRKSSLEPVDRGGAPLSYQDTGDVFDKFEFNLDRIFFTIKPDWFPNAWLSLGKFAHPLKLNPIFAGPVGDLLWDEAAHPEGAAGGYQWTDLAGFDRISAVAGVSSVLELGNLDDSHLFFTQIWLEKRLADPWLIEGGVSYYGWRNLNPDGNTQLSFENNAGNAVVSVGPDPRDVVFASEFSIINPVLVLTYGVAESSFPFLPAQFVWETFLNSGAFDENRDYGYSVGAAYGPAILRQQKGDWQIYYTWNEVQQESLFTPVAQDDFLRATNFRGHMFGCMIYVWDRIDVRVSFLSDEPMTPINGSEQMEWRGRLDLSATW